ncbi:hypothetical protein [Terrabacter terrigena]|uniref:Carboxypeptidase regulatory-like domain-containing protein n=1 Tax=Terrabacter terrigena TaxID=574718 RepID=A0ABW3MVE9_9MICO
MSEVRLQVERPAASEVSETRPVGRRRRRPTAFATVALAVGAVTAWGLTHGVSDARSPATPAVPGVVTGLVPLCHGPGPDTNLTPTLVVVASQHGRTAATVRVPATSAAHAYRLALPPGTYAVRAGSWPSAAVTVSSGATTVVDLPGGSCL